MRRTFLALLAIGAAGASLFVAHGLLFARGDRPLSGPARHGSSEAESFEGETIAILAWHIAKGFVHRGGLRFAPRAEVAGRLGRLAGLIRSRRPDLVFLSEAVLECGAAPGNQVAFLAEATDMPFWVFGENYSFGLPFLRIVGGNAILSRRPLEAVGNPSLPGRRPFYITRNNRRILLCAMPIRGERILLGAIHNDSFDPANNLLQVRWILDSLRGRPAILAGDFNARPHEAPLRLLRDSKLFTGAIEGPPTFPADGPDQRIDYILAPREWELLEHEAIPDSASDHLPVFSRFRVR